MIQDEVKINKQQIKGSMFVAADKQPDRSAEVLKLSNSLSLPAEFVEKNYDLLVKKKEQDSLDYDSLVADSPATAEYLKDPYHAATSKDDIQSLQKIEKLSKGVSQPYYKDVANAFQTGYANLQGSSWLLAASLDKVEDKKEAAQQIAQYNKQVKEKINQRPSYMADFDEVVAKEGGDVDRAAKQFLGSYKKLYDGKILEAVKDWYQGGLSVTPQLIDFIYESSKNKERLKGLGYTVTESLAFSATAMATGAAGAVAGTAVAPGVGTSIGFATGSFAGGAWAEVGAELNSQLEGKGIDITNPEAIEAALNDSKLMAEVRATAARKGLTTAAIDSVFNLFAGKVALPGAAVRAAEKNVVKRAAGKIADKAADIGLQSIGEGVSEAGGQIAREKGDLSKVNFGEAALEGISSIGQSVGEVGFMSMKYAAVESKRALYDKDPVKATEDVAKNTVKAKDAEVAASMLFDLGKVVSESKTVQRNPELINKLLEKVQGEPQTVFFQTNDLDNYWKSKNLSPVTAMEGILGDNVKIYYEAKESSGVVEIPLANLLSKVAATEPAHYEELVKLGKTSVDSFNLVESQEHMGALENTMKDIAKEASEIDSAKLGEDSAKYAEQDKAINEHIENLKQQLNDTGATVVQKKNATANVAMHEAMWKTMARKGIDVKPLLEKYNLKVTGPNNLRDSAIMGNPAMLDPESMQRMEALEVEMRQLSDDIAKNQGNIEVQQKSYERLLFLQSEHDDLQNKLAELNFGGSQSFNQTKKIEGSFNEETGEYTLGNAEANVQVRSEEMLNDLSKGLGDKFGEALEINTLEVPLDEQGAGVGSKVLSEIESIAASMGQDTVVLKAEPLSSPKVGEANPKNLSKLIKFYEKNGYKVYRANKTNSIMFKELNKATSDSHFILKKNEVDQNELPNPGQVKVVSINDSGYVTKNNISKVTKRGLFNTIYKNKKIRVNAKTIKKATNHNLTISENNETAAKEHLLFLKHLDKIINNAVYLTKSEDTKNRGNKWQYYFAIVDLNGQPRQVKLQVLNKETGLELYSYDIVNARGLGPRKSTKHSASATLPASTVQFNDFINEVNQARQQYTFFQTKDGKPQPNELGFYSKLEAEVEKMDFKEMPAKDLANRIKNMQGLKKEELEWNGISEWLGSVESKVSKEEVLSFIRNNGVKLEQVVAGETYEAPKNKPTTRRNTSDEVPRADEVTWNEENLDASEIDPDGSLRSDSAWQNAKEDWRYNRESFSEMIDEIEKDIKEQYPDIDDADLNDKVEEAFLEKRSDELYEFETEQMDSGDSVFAVKRYTIDGLDSGDVHIEYREGSGDADLYIDGRHIRSGDVMLLQQQAVERLLEDGKLSLKPRPTTSEATIQWTQEGGATMGVVGFDNGEDGTFTISGSEEDGWDVSYYGELENYMKDESYEPTTLDDIKNEVIKLLKDEGLLAEMTEDEKQGSLIPVEPVRPNINKATGPSRWGSIALQGGENYREFKLVLPQTEGNHFTGGHFERDTLLHIRTTDRETVDGKKVLFVEEFQSDWHQQGRERGYKKNVSPEAKAEAEKIRKEISELEKNKLPDIRKKEKDHAVEKHKQKYEEDNAPILEKIKDIDSQLAPLRLKSEKLKNEWDKVHDLYVKEDLKLDEVQGKIHLHSDSVLSHLKALANQHFTELEYTIFYNELAYIFRTSGNVVQSSIVGEKRKERIAERFKDHKNKESLEKFIKIIYKDKKFTTALKKFDNLILKLQNMEKAIRPLVEKRDKIDTERRAVNNKIESLHSLRETQKIKLGGDIEDYVKKNKLVDESESRALEKEIKNLEAKAKDLDPQDPVPNAPFKTSSQWMSLGLKRMLSLAHQEGFDMVAWGPGKVHVDRYNQARYLESISYYKEGDAYYVTGKTLKGTLLDVQGPFESEELAGAVGKSVSEKILANEGVEPDENDLPGMDKSGPAVVIKTIKGNDLKIGDTGHIELYDTILRNAAKDVLKKVDKEAKLTVKKASEVFGAPLKEKPHSYRNKTDDLSYEEFWAIDLNSSIKDKISQGIELFQRKKDEPLGQIRFTNNRQMNIELFKNANYSTFLHETGHFFLEVMGDIAEAEAAPQEVKDDYAAILKFLGVSSRSEIKTEHHEKWAESIEKYLMEGKAPSEKLRKVFARFKVWLMSVYKKLDNINVELSDEIRGVMDRMFATQEEIEQAKSDLNYAPLFSSPETYGMSGERALKYLYAMEKAHEFAEGQLFSKLLKDYKRELESWWDEKRSAIAQEVEAEVNNQAVYRAISIMKNGTLADGSALPEGVKQIKLSRQTIIDMYGKEIIKKLPTGIFSKENGVHPTFAAQLLGFEDSDQLIQTLANAPKKEDLINQIADQRMSEMHPDLFDNKTKINEEAVKDLHNGERRKALKMELEHLYEMNRGAYNDALRKTISRMPKDKDIKLMAEKILGQKKINEIKPHMFRNAEVRASKEAARAFTAGDLQAAYEAKRKELLNFELYKAAVEAKEQMEKKAKFFKKLSKKDDRIAKGRDMDLVNAARSILAAYGLGKTDKTPQAYLEKMAKYDPAAFNNILPMIQDSLDNAINFKELKYDDFLALSQTVEALWDLAKDSKEVEIDGKKMVLEEAAQAVADQIDQVSKAKKPLYGSTLSDSEKRKRDFLSLKSLVYRVEHWLEYMDQGGKGALRTYLWNSVDEAVSKHGVEKEKRLLQLKANFEKIKETLTYKPIKSHELKFEFKNKAELLKAMLNTGNESNKRKLLLGYDMPWGEVDDDGNLITKRWDDFINRMVKEGVLTKADYDFMQSVWDMFEEMKPEAQKAHKKLYGYYFDEITAAPFSTTFGEYRGGYIPMSYDPFLSQDAQRRLDAQAILENESTFMPPSTGRGFTKARVNAYSAPVALDLTGLERDIDKILRFTHIEPAVRQTYRLIENKQVTSSLSSYDPVIKSSVLMPWLQRSATQKKDNTSSNPAVKVLERGARMLRTNASMQIMSYYVTNALQNMTGAFVAAVKVKPIHLKRAAINYFKNTKSSTEFITGKSDFMKTRVTTQLMDAQKSIKAIAFDETKYEKTKEYIKENGKVLQTMTQGTIDKVTWLGAYDQAVAEGLSDKEAVRSADSAVRLTQGSFRGTDVSSVENLNEFTQLMSMFYGYFNNLANLNVSQMAKVVNESGFKTGAPKLFYIYAFGFMLPSIVAEIIMRAMSGQGVDSDDDDEVIDDIFSIIFLSQFRVLTAMVPFIGQIGNNVASLFNDKKFDDRITGSPVFGMVEKSVRAVKSVPEAVFGDGDKGKAVSDFMNLIGLLTGAPVAPLAKPISYSIGVGEGDYKPSGPIDFTRGLVTGKGDKRN